MSKNKKSYRKKSVKKKVKVSNRHKSMKVKRRSNRKTMRKSLKRTKRTMKRTKNMKGGMDLPSKRRKLENSDYQGMPGFTEGSTLYDTDEDVNQVNWNQAWVNPLYGAPSNPDKSGRRWVVLDKEAPVLVELKRKREEADRIEAEAARIEAARIEAARIEAARIEAARIEDERRGILSSRGNMDRASDVFNRFS